MTKRSAFFWIGFLVFLVSCTSPESKPIEVDTLTQPSQEQTGRFELTNTGDEAITFELESRNNTRNGQAVQQWYTLEPQDATLQPGASVEVELATNGVFSAPGTYRSEVVVDYPGGPTVFEVSAQIPSQTGPQVSLSPSSLTVQPGQTKSSTISSSGFSGDVTLSFSRGNDGLPADQLDINGSSMTISGTETATLQVTPKNDAALGTYQIVITGRSGSQTDTATLSVTVPGAGGGPGSISGTVQTSNNLENFTVPNDPKLPTPMTLSEKPEYVEGQLLVKLRTDGLTSGSDSSVYGQLEALLELDYPITVLRSGGADMPTLVAVSPGQDAETLTALLERDPRVAYAEPNYYIYLQALPNDPQNNKLWHLAASGLPVAWNAENSSAVTVAVIDSGIDLDHPDLKGVFLQNQGGFVGYDFCATTSGSGSSRTCATRDNNPRPQSNSDTHGTHVTGTIAAVGNSQGVAGVLYGGARIVPIKVFYQGDFTTAFALAEAIRWSVGLTVSSVPQNSNPAKIVNLSLGFEPQPGNESQAVQNAVSAAQGTGALLIAATGNGGNQNVLAPARYSGVIGVGSVNSQFRRSCFSNYGTGLDIVAAAGDYPINSGCPKISEAVFSTFPGNNYGVETGTSHATPIVTGVAALVWEQTTSPTAAKVSQKLKDSAYFDSSYMNANQYGAGLLRADVALGLPGPTDNRRTVQTTVTASGSGGSDTDIVTLDLLLGVSDAFSLTGLGAGTYTLEAAASGVDLDGQATVTLQGGGAQQDIIVTP